MPQINTSFNELTTSDQDMLTEIAVLYYQEGATQDEISKKFAISRVKVGRLLRKAREEGIVEINVRYHPVYSAQLERRLVDKFKLKRALIALDHSDEEEQRKQVRAGVVQELHYAQQLYYISKPCTTLGMKQNFENASQQVHDLTQKLRAFKPISKQKAVLQNEISSLIEQIDKVSAQVVRCVFFK